MIKTVDIQSLELKDVSFAFPGQAPIFEGLSCDLSMNGNTYVMGASGSGLSTFLRILAVMTHPVNGHLFMNGHAVREMTFEEFLPYRLQIGYSFEIGGLFANRTMKENLTLPLLYHKRASFDDAGKIADDLAESYGFANQKDQRPALVSGGLRKLVCVLRSMILKPQMLVLDDPFGGIGMEAARNIVRAIQEQREHGGLKHVFLTSRDELWPQWLGCHQLQVERNGLQFEAVAVAA